MPGGYGVRVDTHIYAGYNVPPFYDPLLAKIIVWAEDRPAAIQRMLRCLHETKIVGVKTNIQFQQRILSNAFFGRGEITTDFIKWRVLSDHTV